MLGRDIQDGQFVGGRGEGGRRRVCVLERDLQDGQFVGGRGEGGKGMLCVLG